MAFVVLIMQIRAFSSTSYNGEVEVVEVEGTDTDSVVMYETAFMRVGDQCDFSWLLNVDSYYFSVTNTDVAESIETNRRYVVGKSAGTTTVVVTYITDLSTIGYASFLLEVLADADLAEGAYHIRSAVPSRDYMLYPDATFSKASFYSYETSLYALTSIQIFSFGNGRYALFCLAYNAYIGVAEDDLYENAPVNFYPSVFGYIPYWNILRDSNGKYIFVPDCGENTNLVLSVPYPSTTEGTPLVLTNFYTRASTREYSYKAWNVFSDTLTIDTYYDGSVAADLTVYNLIPSANAFAERAIEDSLQIPMAINTSYTRYVSTADGCSLGNNSSCTDTCGTVCSAHHKNERVIMEQVKTLPHENNHIVVSWMNRPLKTYCKRVDDVHSIEASVVADATVNSPYVSIRTVKGVPGDLGTAQSWETVMSIIVTHEIAHTLGLTEQYDVEGHCMNEEGEKAYSCCMERLSYGRTCNYSKTGLVKD